MKSYRIAIEPVDDVYTGLLAASPKLSSAGFLAVRATIDLAKRGREILGKLRAFLIRESRDSQWPGTVLLANQAATVFRFSICPESVEILQRSANRLYEWQQPDLPEDLGLLRADGTPWLISITHESEAYVIAADQELQWLKGEVPGLGPLIPEDIGDLT